MFFKIVFKCELLLTMWTLVSFDVAMPVYMVLKVFLANDPFATNGTKMYCLSSMHFLPVQLQITQALK